jgi:hypothetical protein
MNKTEQRKKALVLILDAIRVEDNPTIEHTKARFYNEFGWRIKQVGESKACLEWFQGLVLNVPHYTYAIERELGFQDGSEYGEYWSILSFVFLAMIKGTGKVNLYMDKNGNKKIGQFNIQTNGNLDDVHRLPLGPVSFDELPLEHLKAYYGINGEN